MRKRKSRHSGADDYRVSTPQLAASSADVRIISNQQLNCAKQNKRRATEKAVQRATETTVETARGTKRPKAAADFATAQPNRLFGAVEEWFARKRAKQAELQGVNGDGTEVRLRRLTKKTNAVVAGLMGYT